jgi:uncharacterized membrane protein YhhN
MLAWLLLPLFIVSVFLLIRAQERAPRDERQIKIWKPLSTALVIAVCVLSLTLPADRIDSTYTLLIGIGLLFSLAGDVLLIDQTHPRAFIAGLAAFLVAHLVYIAGFTYLQSSRHLGVNTTGEIASGLALAVAAIAIYRYLSPGLGSMRVPVIAYMAIISIMVHRAIALALVETSPVAYPALVVAGALLFYVSDAILAVNKFRFDGKLSRASLWNLSAYYAGQMLIALSASFLL